MKRIQVFLEFHRTQIDKCFQTFSVFFLQFLFLQGGSWLALTALIYFLLFTNYYWICLAYLAWYIYDYNTCFQGGRLNHWSRSWKLWDFYCKYFPINLIKTADLDSMNENYIFCVHPHGIMCLSGFGNFCTEGIISSFIYFFYIFKERKNFIFIILGTQFSKLFPGLKPHVLMLQMLFRMPLTRELLLFVGASAVSPDSFNNILNNSSPQCKDKGQVCVVVIGGAAESLEAHPNTYRY
jgi:hypothetical protein